MNARAVLPAMPYYEAAIAAAIKAQYRFKADSPKNERLTGQQVTVVDGVIANGRIETNFAGRYAIPASAFGAGDFTIECKLTLLNDIESVVQIMGVIQGTSAASQNNSWNLYYSSGVLRFGVWPSVQVAYNTFDMGALTLGVENHIVIERVGNTISGYVNGALRGSLAFTAALVVPTDPTITSYHKTNPTNYKGSRYLRDIRIADRALYRGAVNNNIKSFNSKAWHRDSVLAIDSYVHPSGAGQFIDYNGLQCVSANNAFAAGGSAPTVGTETFKYGKGIRILKGGFFAAQAGQINRDMFAQDWTVDFWYKDETASADNVRPGVHPFVAYVDMTANNATNRIIVGPSPGGSNPPVTYWVLWNNIANIAATSTIRHEMKGTEWAHFAIEYDSTLGATHFYKNGTRQGTINYRFVASQANQQVGACALATGPISVMERYRLRTGKRFNGNFNPDEIY